MEMLASSNSATTIGILYCGELGSAFGKLLHKSGLRVVTTCQGRSQATVDRARSSEIEILPTLNDLAAQSHVVFSFVLPSAAVEVAQQYALCHSIRPINSIFVEGNSVGLETLEQIERVMGEHEIPLVDAAVNGMANRLEDLGVLHVSGPRAGTVEAMCRGLVRVNDLGTRVGSASRMKLLMSGIAKGLPALFLEVAALAERADLLESFLKSCQLFYPAIMTVVERTLPTFPRHASRRVGEMWDIENMARALHSRAGMTHEAGEWIHLMSTIPWEQETAGSPADIRTVIQSVAKACASENRPGTFSEVLK
jgi:3-hydroxyisobutyrate dehydrogenase-like beta-hydroxyacid dehydrogenase